MNKWYAILLLSMNYCVQAAPSVSVEPVSQLIISKAQTAPAAVVSTNQSKISSEITAMIKQINVEVVQSVKQGDALVLLDCRVLKARLAQQRAILSTLTENLKYTKSQLSRANNLKKDKNISEELFEKRQADQRSLEAKILAQRQLIKIHQLDVEKCIVLAPYDGVIEARLASVGELALPGTPLIQIRQTDNLEVSAQIRSEQVLSTDDAIFFEIGHQRYPLAIARISPLVDTHTRAREVRLLFTDQVADSGTAGRISWTNKQKWLPSDLLVRRDEQLGVFLLKQGKAVFIALPNAIEGQDVAVKFNDQDKVIVDGRHLINDGDSVNVQQQGAK